MIRSKYILTMQLNDYKVNIWFKAKQYSMAKAFWKPKIKDQVQTQKTCDVFSFV